MKFANPNIESLVHAAFTAAFDETSVRDKCIELVHTLIGEGQREVNAYFLVLRELRETTKGKSVTFPETERMLQETMDAIEARDAAEFEQMLDRTAREAQAMEAFVVSQKKTRLGWE